MEQADPGRVLPVKAVTFTGRRWIEDMPEGPKADPEAAAVEFSKNNRAGEDKA